MDPPRRNETLSYRYLFISILRCIVLIMATSAAGSPDQAAGQDTAATSSGGRHQAKVGRKRDAARDGVILDAALTVLAEQGYEGMTIDMVAAEAGMARATVYRRWAAKADLVLEAVSRMSHSDVGLARLPERLAWIHGHDVLAPRRGECP